MKTNLLKSIFISLILVMGVSNAWGWNSWNNKTIYFDNSLWASDNYTPQLLIGRYYTWGGDSRGSSAMSLTKIQNTNLWYLKNFTYSNYTSQYFIANATTWGNEYGCSYDGCENTPENRYKYATHYTNSYNTDGNSKYNLFIPESKDNNASLAYYHNSNYSTLLNYNQTVQQHLSTNGGAYATSTASIATVTVSSYKLSNETTAAADSKTIASGSSSATCSAARTATVTYTVESVKTGYTFVGWYDGNTQKSTNETYTYNATGAKTITARFKENTYSVTVNNDGHGTTTPSGAQSNVGQVTGLSINATPAANYEFVNWTITSGSGSFGSTTNASTTFKPTSDATIQANFRSTVTYSLTVVAGNGISQVTGSKDLVTLGSTYAITATPKTGYTFDTWTANPAANATFGSATTANTTVTVNNGSVTVTASATENMSTLTTSNKYDAGNPSYAAPSATVNSIGIATTATVTATAAGNGYTFTGWTLTNCTRTDGGAADATSITVRSDGDGKAATVVANYTEDLATSWVLKGSFVDDFKTAYDFTKKTGESTGDIAYVSLDLVANKEYKFKVVNGSTWYGNNNYNDGDEKWWIKATMNDPWEFYSDAGNCYMKSALAGTYTFKIDYSGTNPKVSVYFPEIYALVGSFNNWNENTNKFVFAGNTGTTTVNLQGSATNYEFKIIDNAVHGGMTSKTITKTEANMAITVGGGDNIKLTANVYPNGEYVFTYDKSTKKLSVTYPTAYTVTYGVGTNKGTDKVTTDPSFSSESLVLASTPITFSKGATKAGYTWKNWNSKADGTGTNLGTGDTYVSTSRAGDISVYACYDLITYNITYNTNGGTNPNNAQTSYNVTTATFNLPTPTKTGHTFAGWYTTSDFSGNNVTQITNGSTDHKEFWAKWDPNTYTVKFNANGGSGSMADQTFTYNEEEKALTANTFTQSGYDFVGWNTLANGTGTPYTDSQKVQNLTDIANGTITLYAQWKAQSFELTWNLNGGTPTTPGSPEGGEVEAGTPLTPPIVTKDHYDHTGWTPEEPTVMPGEDVTYTAQWTPKKYTITYNLNGGNGTMTPTTYTIESETFTLPTNPTKTGHTFAGWYDNAELTGNAVTQIEKGSTGDKAYWAKWDVASYTINFNQQSGSDGTPSVTAQYGAKLSAITIPSRDGYLFDGYYTQTGGKGTKYYNADGTTTKNMPANNLTLYANWIGYDHCIFFKNTLGTLGWKDIYVYTFSADTWDSYVGVKVKNKYIEYGKMTQIGKTDIFYYVLTDLTGFNYIAFSNAAMNTYDEFYGNNAIYRGDRSDQLQLFIPNATGSTKVVNQTKYYNDGIWMKYNSMDSGYDWSGKTADSDWSDHSLLAEKKGDYSFTTTVSLTAGTNYEFKISNVGKDADNEKIKETAWYGWNGTMTQANCTNKHFKHNTSNNAMITPTVDGDYTFTVYLGDGKVMVSLEYPLSKDDYRLAYDDITLSNIHEGHYLKKRTTGEILDTVSFFVRKDKTPQILLQQCTNIVDGKPTWATVNTYNITVNADGVYNFVLKQTNSGTHTATLETSATHKYTGDYYVRTDAAEGGWKSYRQASNRMNYSTYADSHSEFNHYFCSYREAGCNVKFIVANDYSECLTDTMDNDNIIQPNQSSVGCLPANANIRFGWNSETNQLSRAYISGAGLVKDRFLVLMGNEYLKDAEGKALVEGTNGSPRYGLKANEEIFADMGNWIYQVDVQACNLTTIRLSALYNGEEQLFKGARNDISLLNSTEPKYYKVRMIYDFKTNHMISAWLLDEQGDTIQGTGSLASDILVIRKNQDQANQLTFKGDAERTDVGVVYGVMTFEKDFVNDTEKSIYERALYWISFPFNVKLKDIFGFSNYGDHWILEEYNGQARAENGAWVDSESYWEYITNSEYELEAGKGYVLCLDLDKMGVNSDVFQHTDEVSLYFPSKEELGTINGDPTPITLDPYTCIIKRDNRDIYDSNWHLIGVPRFADIKTENINIIPQPTQEDVGFYYEYGSNGEYTVKKSGATTFHTMSAYLVQYAGVINWTSTGITVPAAIAARKNSPAEPEQVHLRLEIAQDDEMADQTFVQLQQEGATAEFDMNLDLTKMLHSGTNIYTLAGEQGIKSAGNVMPMSECVVPVGVKVDAEGKYTFRMPDGTEGMVVELIDYYTNTRTNLLLFDYTVDLSAGTCNDRFALHIQPSKSGVTTGIEGAYPQTLPEGKGTKFLIDGKLIIRTAEGEVFDAQGHRL